MPASRAVSAINALKPALVLGFVIVFVHLFFVAADAWRLDRERGNIEASMRQLFQSSFPEATTIVDPALQMSRNLARLKSERGLATDPVRDALASAATITKALPPEVTAAISTVSADANLLSVAFSSLSVQQQTQLQDVVARAANPQAARAAATLDGDRIKIPVAGRP